MCRIKWECDRIESNEWRVWNKLDSTVVGGGLEASRQHRVSSLTRRRLGLVLENCSRRGGAVMLCYVESEYYLVSTYRGVLIACIYTSRSNPTHSSPPPCLNPLKTCSVLVVLSPFMLAKGSFFISKILLTQVVLKLTEQCWA